MTCGSDGKFSACVVEVGPASAELCNGLDDDCDGAIDEGFDLKTDSANCGVCGVRCSFPNAAAACSAGVCARGSCENGYVDLDGVSQNGCEYKCPVNPPTSADVCGNKLDDNCDGRVDEGCACDPTSSARLLCGNNQGLCRASMTCGADGKFSACVVEVGPAPAELCNGLDDDCDGQTDEGFDLKTDPANCGACGVRCSFPNATAACSNGVCARGSCESGYVDLDGVSQNGCEYKCPVDPPASAELCGNSLDDDCDGRVDEGCECDPTSSARVFCGNNQGLCRASMTCGTDGKFTACVVDVGPSPEICNGLDDDCDGLIDEGFDLKTDPANCGACGTRCFFPNAAAVCAASVCVRGSCTSGYVDLDGISQNGCEYKCPVNPPAPAEVCGNGLDDDCNGLAEEGCSGGTPVPDGGPPPPQAPLSPVLEVQSITKDTSSHAESVVCSTATSGMMMDFQVTCRQWSDGQYSWAQCIATPATTGTFDLDNFDADNGNQGALEVRFCLSSRDGGPITGGIDLWYGEYPRRKILKLLADSERQGIVPGCYARTFNPSDADPARFLVNTSEQVVRDQIPTECRFATQADADAWVFNGKWTSRGAACKFSYKNTKIWITAESCVQNVNAELSKLTMTYHPLALLCSSAGACRYSDRPKCAPASDVPACAETRFYCGGLCQPDCDGAGSDCEVHLNDGTTCSSKIACLNGVPVCPMSGCEGAL
jgi:hypothetical protein